MESSVCLAFFVVGFIYTVLYGIAFFLHAIALRADALKFLIEERFAELKHS